MKFFCVFLLLAFCHKLSYGAENPSEGRFRWEVVERFEQAELDELVDKNIFTAFAGIGDSWPSLRGYAERWPLETSKDLLIFLLVYESFLNDFFECTLNAALEQVSGEEAKQKVAYHFSRTQLADARTLLFPQFLCTPPFKGPYFSARRPRAASDLKDPALSWVKKFRGGAQIVELLQSPMGDRKRFFSPFFLIRNSKDPLSWGYIEQQRKIFSHFRGKGTVLKYFVEVRPFIVTELEKRISSGQFVLTEDPFVLIEQIPLSVPNSYVRVLKKFLDLYERDPAHKEEQGSKGNFSSAMESLLESFLGD